MSILFSLLLLLLLLQGLSLHACDARTLGAVVHHSIKETDEKLNPGARVSNDGDDEKVKNESNDDDDQTTESESVRWRVPHRKKGEAEPGFNSDYLPPKTHPPVHN